MGGGASETYLAEALGITAAELQTAQQTANQAAIDEALAQGLITQAQADALKASSDTFGRGGRGFHGFLGMGDSTIDMDVLLADALGITTDELAAARVEAQDLALAAAVEAGNITQEQADQMKAEQSLKTYLDEQGYQTQIQTLYENLVKQAVQAGVLTQEQADSILSNQGGLGGMRGFGACAASATWVAAAATCAGCRACRRLIRQRLPARDCRAACNWAAWTSKVAPQPLDQKSAAATALFCCQGWRSRPSQYNRGRRSAHRCVWDGTPPPTT